MKVVDFGKKGNVARLYLGRDDDFGYWGDDWDDRPYEHNAGRVYPEYVEGWVDIAFPYGVCLLEPADDWRYGGNSPFSKEDFKAGHAPCLAAVPPALDEWRWDDSFSEAAGRWDSLKVCFGDDEDEVLRRVLKFGGTILARS